MGKVASGLLGLVFAFAILNPAPVAAENVLRWASASGALTADPHAYDEIPTHAQLAQVYERLLDFDSNLDLVPQLALAWRLVEPTIWDFELHPNVRFHDGTPFTAEDVVFSITRAKTELPVGFAGRMAGWSCFWWGWSRPRRSGSSWSTGRSVRNRHRRHMRTCSASSTGW